MAYVVIDEPRTSTHGGTVAAPAFAAVLEQALLYYGIPPEPELWAGEEGWIHVDRVERDRFADLDDGSEAAIAVGAGI